MSTSWIHLGSLYCQQIQDKVHISIDAVHKRSKLKYEDAIPCPAHPGQNHVAMWRSHSKEYYKCTVESGKSGSIPKGYEVWKKALHLMGMLNNNVKYPHSSFCLQAAI